MHQRTIGLLEGAPNSNEAKEPEIRVPQAKGTATTLRNEGQTSLWRGIDFYQL